MSDWRQVFSAAELERIDRIAATYCQWAEEGCPQCGARNPYYGVSERGDISVTCSACSWQERFVTDGEREEGE